MSIDWRARAQDWLTGRLEPTALPASVGTKFSAVGEKLRFPGNTFLCHIDPASQAFAALTKAQAALRNGLAPGAYAFLPPSSFHMTVFEGVCDAHRDDARWPAGIDSGAPVEKVTARWLDLSRGMSLPQTLSIAPCGIFGGFSVRVDGATEADRQALWSIRRALRAATGIQRPDFESYQFHVTLAYNIRWLTEAEAAAAQDLSDRVFAQLQGRAATIALGPVEFCTFDDMHRFDTLCRIPA